MAGHAMRVLAVLGGLATVGLVVFSLAAPASAESQVALTGGIPVRLSGAIGLDAEEGTVVADSPPRLLGLDGAATGRIVTVQSDYVPVPDGSLLRIMRTVVVAPHAIDGLSIESAGQGFFAAATGARVHVESVHEAASAEDVWAESNVQLSLLLHDRTLAPRVAAAANDLVADPQAGAGALRLARGLHESRADQATAQLELGRLVVHDAQIRTLEGATHVGRETVTRPGSVYTASGWTGPGEHLEETVRVLIVDGAGSPLRIDGDLTLYSDDLLAHVDGLAQFAWAEGHIQGDAADEIAGKTLLGGRFGLRTLGTDLERAPSVAWLGAGDLRLLALGPAPVSDAAAVAVTVAAGGAAVGLAALLYYWPALKYALLAPLYARLPRDRVLDHSGRELVYERIRGEPGISAHRLADAVDFGWSTLAYHLRVLEKNELIVSVRDGRYRRFFDRESGRYANGRKHLVAVLKNEQTNAIARAVLDAPGVTQKELAERFGLSPSSVHWHVQRLEAARLLNRVRDGHHVRYHPGEAWSEIDPADVGLGPPAGAAVQLAPNVPVATGPSLS